MEYTTLHYTPIRRRARTWRSTGAQRGCRSGSRPPAMFGCRLAFRGAPVGRTPQGAGNTATASERPPAKHAACLDTNATMLTVTAQHSATPVHHHNPTPRVDARHGGTEERGLTHHWHRSMDGWMPSCPPARHRHGRPSVELRIQRTCARARARNVMLIGTPTPLRPMGKGDRSASHRGASVSVIVVCPGRSAFG
jgi:hypothetical protein